MGHRFAEIAFTTNVKNVQAKHGSRRSYQRMEQGETYSDVLGDRESAFIAARDSFYLATVSETGWPYIQHRGGPPGFLHVFDGKTIGFADYRGNRQYITLGNLSENDKAYIFLMDYANRRRIKIWGRARIVEDDPHLLEGLVVPGAGGRPEHALVFEIEAWDTNCPRHIPHRHDQDEVARMTANFRARIAELEAEVKRLRGSLGPAALPITD